MRSASVKNFDNDGDNYDKNLAWAYFLLDQCPVNIHIKNSHFI